MKNIFFSEEGDFLLRNGNVALATETNQEALLNKILHRIQTNADDWSIENQNLVEFYNIDLGNFIPGKVTRELISVIKFLIVASLTEDRLLEEENIELYDLPINHNTLFLKMSIMLEEARDKPILIDMIYDLRANRLIPKVVNVPENQIWQN